MWHKHGAMARPARSAQPLDAATLERLALRYVERFATTRAKLRSYLHRKVRERGWSGSEPAGVDALCDRIVELGYIDDRAFAEAKGVAMTRRGLGARRVGEALRAAGIEERDRGEVRDIVAERSGVAALTFARRRRIGPFAPVQPDRDQRERQMAQMLRAGHDFATARRIVDAAPGEILEDIDPDQEISGW